MRSRILQTAALVVAWPFLWLVGLVTFSLVCFATMARGVRKVWK